MENNIIEIVKLRIAKSNDDIYRYAELVSDLEFFREQNPQLFHTKELSERYDEIWMKLEILNACALSEWEECGRPKNFDEIWKEKYIKDAQNLLQELIVFMSEA